jgi:hypothetical protein
MKKKNYEQEVEKYIETKRKDFDNRNARFQDLVKAVQNSFQPFNIKSVQIGKETLTIGEEPTFDLKLSNTEEHILQKIQTGEKIFLLSVTNVHSMYLGKEKTQMKKQKIEDLLDVSLIQQIDPNIQILHPTTEKPFSRFFDPNSYMLIIQGQEILEKIWQNLSTIVKKNWHDDIMKKQQFFHSFDNVFQIYISFNISQDFLLKIARFKKATANYDQQMEFGNYSSVSQQELKNTLRSLVILENHPFFGNKIQQMIQEIKPLLVQSMKDKDNVEKYRKIMEKSLHEVYQAYSFLQMDFKNWNQEVPEALNLSQHQLKNKNKI